jgi:hypothetical protein
VITWRSSGKWRMNSIRVLRIYPNIGRLGCPTLYGSTRTSISSTNAKPIRRKLRNGTNFSVRKNPKTPMGQTTTQTAYSHLTTRIATKNLKTQPTAFSATVFTPHPLQSRPRTENLQMPKRKKFSNPIKTKSHIVTQQILNRRGNRKSLTK